MSRSGTRLSSELIKLLGFNTPVRSSPRLSKSQVNIPKIVEDAEANESSSSPIILSPRSLKRVKGRRSLSRQVMESNALNALLSATEQEDVFKLSSTVTSFEELTKSKSETRLSSTSMNISEELSLKYSSTKR